MTASPSEPNTMIRLNKLVRASKQRVYDAWVKPEQACQWWCPGPDITCENISIDARVGGEMRVTMRSGEQAHVGVGTFTLLEEPDRIAYTWNWENNPDFGGNSLVTLEFIEAENPYDDGPATEVILTHERLNSAAERSEHTGGWWTTLRALGYYVRGVDPREAMYGKAETAS